MQDESELLNDLERALINAPSDVQAELVRSKIEELQNSQTHLVRSNAEIEVAGVYHVENPRFNVLFTRRNTWLHMV